MMLSCPLHGAKHLGGKFALLVKVFVGLAACVARSCRQMCALQLAHVVHCYGDSSLQDTKKRVSIA
ncbi:MAG: hypothetical protein IJ761_04650 [Bacteroidales bacterium]|nr:hypothetical protein [Bacteroidales bacterium]